MLLRRGAGVELPPKQFLAYGQASDYEAGISHELPYLALIGIEAHTHDLVLVNVTVFVLTGYCFGSLQGIETIIK